MEAGAILGTVLVVDACADTNALLGDPSFAAAGLAIERTADPEGAIARVEGRDALDVVLLAPRLADPVRVAQRLHSLDRQGAIVILTLPERLAEVRHAFDVAPFLEGDIVLTTVSDGASLAAELAAAAVRTRTRRGAQAARKKRRDTPPPLSARYLGTLLDSAPIGIVTLDADAAVIGWNRRAGEMLGVAEVDALGSEFAELFAENDRPALTELIGSFDTAGIAAAGLVAHRGGRAFEVSGARFAIRSGEHGSLLILQDITKRVQTERELELRNALLEAEANSAEAGIALTTLDGEVLLLNKRWGEIWGAEDQADAFTVPGDELAAGRSFRDEVQLEDGRTIERYATDARSADGEVLGRAWFHTDITARRREEEALRVLADATQLLSSSFDYETTLQRVAELVVPKIASWCSVEIAGRHGHRAVAIAHSDPAQPATIREARERYPSAETYAVGQVIAGGEPLVFPELSEEDIVAFARDEVHLGILRKLDVRSVMIVPIKVRERVFGAMSFIRGASDPIYEDDDLRLAVELARRAAIAIDNSRVHAELRETARTLQESLLPPHLPAIPNVELAARFRPAGAGMQVGGDFYDIFDTGDERWAVAIGDVCGKGAEAAAVTALTRYTVRAAAMYEESAAGVLDVLNRALLRQRGDFRFTTLAFCVMDLGDGRCTLTAACGGHPRPLLLRADGSVAAVGASGPLVGVLADAEFGESATDLHRGDLLLLYTDGLTDAHAPGRMITEDDLIAELRACAGLGAGEVAARIEDAALGGSAELPRDDMALVVVKLGASDRRARRARRPPA